MKHVILVLYTYTDGLAPKEGQDLYICYVIYNDMILDKKALVLLVHQDPSRLPPWVPALILLHYPIALYHIPLKVRLCLLRFSLRFFPDKSYEIWGKVLGALMSAKILYKVWG